MEFVHEVTNYINSLPASTWTTLGSYLAGSTLVATVLQVAKHKFNFAGASKFVVFALGFLSFLAAFADLLLQANAVSPLPQLGHVTGLLMAGAVVVHRFAISPAYYSVTNKLKGFNTLLKEAESEEATPSKVIPVNVDLPEEANLAQFQVPAV